MGETSSKRHRGDDPNRTTIVAVLVGALACSGSGCSCPADPGATAQRQAPAVEPTVAPAPAPGPAPGVRDDGTIVTAVPWFEGTLEQATAEAARTGKLVFVDVGAYWCPPCHRLDEEVFVDAEVGRLLGERFVPVHIDAEKGEGPELVERYRVQAFPTLLVLEPTGVEKGRIVDFVPKAELVAALARIEAGQNVLADLAADVQAHPDDLALRYRLGHAYALATRREQAEAEFKAVMVGDPNDELGLASQVLYDRALFFTYKLDGERDRAIAEFEALQARYPDSKAALRAYRQLGRLHCEAKRPDVAIANLDRMLAEDPDDAELAASYGWFSFREKCRPEAGLAVVERALEQHSDNAELHYLKAELRHLTGDDDEAAVAMRRASELEPESAFYKRMVQRFSGSGGA